MSALHLIIHGRVQGVGYREWLTNTARALGLTGWVRNLTDGTVEAVIAGSEAAMQACLAACHEGPLHARVSKIESIACDAPASPDFVKKTSAARQS
jgi:acylphosphatase